MPAPRSLPGPVRRGRATAAVGALTVAGLAVASCSSSTSAQGPPATKGPPSSASTPAAPTTTRPATATTTTSAALDLPVTDAIRTQLVSAGAALHDAPVSQYSGLAPGLTYYALDRRTNTYWAAARLVPAPSPDPNSPTQAQIASQDEGSYTVFSQPQGGNWTAYATGNTGPDTPCAVTIPPEVLAVWGWAPGSCRPAGV